MIYLATPYSDSNPVIREERYFKACEIAHTLLQECVPAYVPIAMWHPLNERFGLTGSWECYQIQDRAFLDRALELWVIEMEGWNRSKGVGAEVEYFSKVHGAGKIFHYTPFEIAYACEQYHERISAKRDALVEDAMKTATAAAGLGTPTDSAPGQAILIGGLPAALGVAGRVQLPGGMKKDT